ncbi:MAG TPA: glycosyltransferase family 4 protein [Candidatus Thermoplasmatota archaeon]|nr:glycosyltransferase family 4 protein [Candidatus Thermoplasmatota archaeon]
MRQPRLCLFTQTPLTRFLRPGAPSEVAWDDLVEGEDHLPSPGGVTRMLRALLAQWHEERRHREVAWLTLAAADSPRVRLPCAAWTQGLALAPREQEAYAAAKGALWSVLHRMPSPLAPDEVAEGLAPLSALLGARARGEHARDPFDVFYAHDFQLLPLASELPHDAPAVLRWHAPVVPMPPAWEAYVARALDAYDAVIVSTAGYARELRRMGVRAPIRAAYPYLDFGSPHVVASPDVAAFEARHGLAPDDVVFTVVARLDPIKSQDVAIRAMPRVLEREPRARLLLVGGGGFSAGRGGLGMGHGASWRADLERLAADLGVADRVTFTGGVLDAELEAAYARSRAVLLPSALEGFGLAPVEAWIRGLPVVVSRGAGVAELVREGWNGFACAPDDPEDLARGMVALARDAAAARAMGARGRATARACDVATAAGGVWDVLARAAGRPAPRARERSLA